MTSSFSGVNLSTLPFPDIIEELDFETVFSQMLADLQARDEVFTALVESDPAYKILEVSAYREILLRGRINDSAKAVSLAYAVGNDLDNLAANFNVARLLITPADPQAVPPVPAVYESDKDFRRRIQLSFEGFSNAGSAGAYIFHALSASGTIRDVGVKSPVAGQVLVTLQTYNGGLANSGLISTVLSALNADEIRPLTDQVTVQSVVKDEFEVVAVLEISALQADSELVRAEAESELIKLVQGQNTIGRSIPLSAIYAALHRPNVLRVTLIEPTADVDVLDTHFAYCTNISVTIGG
jgi:phage-related baseplate assembly protein